MTHVSAIDASRSRQVCDSCGAEYDERDARTACARCAGLLALQHPDAIRGDALRARFDVRLEDAMPRHVARGDAAIKASGVWRFRELILPSATDAEIVSQPEGNTPLVHRDAVAHWAGVEALYLKHDGYNPTGSFKDRGMTVAITQARRVAARAVACASTGNTSASLAAYASLAGIPSVVVVPAGAVGGAIPVASGKLAQTLAYGAHTLLVRGDFDVCLRLLRDASDQLGVYLANSVNPFRVAGQESVALEILQQLGWNAPDWIVVPAGNLGNTSAVGAALRDAVRHGLIARAPRIASIQAAGAAPFAQAFREGFATRRRVTAATVATAIKIGDPASWNRAVRAIRETDGVVAAVADEDLLEAQAVINASAVGCEPASAASVAGVRRLVREGVIKPQDRVAAILTGHILKDPDVLLQYHRADDGVPRRFANPPIEIEATIDALAKAVDAAVRRVARA